MLLRERLKHHAPLLEKSVEIMIGFASGLSTEKPYFWQGMGICPFEGKNIIFKPYTQFEKFDSIEVFVSKQKENGSIVINHSLFQCELEELINFLINLKKEINRLINLS